MVKKRVFISYDFDNDAFLKTALVGQAAHPDSPFELHDHSLKHALTGDWETKITPRIKGADLVIVMCGEKTHTATGVSAELAIAQTHNIPYFHLWGYSDKMCVKPLKAKSDDKIYKWDWDTLKQLIGGAR